MTLYGNRIAGKIHNDGPVFENDPVTGERSSFTAGQLTTTLQLDEADQPLAKELLPELEEISGRILCNGFPTGVEVADSMMHGGPYPASTSSSSTSVGTLAIRRFLRPVAYQNFPKGLLPADLSV